MSRCGTNSLLEGLPRDLLDLCDDMLPVGNPPQVGHVPFDALDEDVPLLLWVGEVMCGWVE